MRLSASYINLFVGLLWCAQTQAELNFPKLTGRVMDQAGLMSVQVSQRLENQLQAHEAATKNQIVIVTLNSLQGVTIEEYGYQLGRAWGIGQKGENNGVLLIVVPKDRKVRIEVGYGLEGKLTDAISSNIIQSKILPNFREKKFETGIIEGALGIVDALGGQYQFSEVSDKDKKEVPWWVVFFLPLIFLRRFGLGGFYGHHGGGHRGGGFKGGGGGFGGGGASGGW
jgi:uncharacterized protein